MNESNPDGLEHIRDQLRDELREEIQEFTLKCSRRFPMLGYEWIDIILAFFTDLKIKFLIDNKLREYHGRTKKEEAEKRNIS